MTAGFGYLGGTLAVWAALFGELLAISMAVRGILAIAGEERAFLVRRFVAWQIFAGGCALVAALLHVPVFRETGFDVPLVWLMMPFAAWGTIVCLLVAVCYLAQVLLQANPYTMGTRAAGWALAATGSYAWLRYSKDPVTLFRGTIHLTIASMAILLVLAITTACLITILGRKARSHRGLMTFSTHLGLVTGSLLFGAPFAWLLITSLKEPRDVSAESGLVFIPKVQETVSYMDPEDPYYRGEYQGHTIEGRIIDRKPGGIVTVDLDHPMAIRGLDVDLPMSKLTKIPKDLPVVTGKFKGQAVEGMVVKEMDDGRRLVHILRPAGAANNVFVATPEELEAVRHVGLRWQNYTEAIDYMPIETDYGLSYVRNTLIIVLLSVLGTIISSSMVAYAFSRLRFPGRDVLFGVLISTMMLPGAVTLLPTFLLFNKLGWVNTLLPLWVPAFFTSAFNVFLLRQFFKQIPMELEDAAKIDGCSYLKTYWAVMMPQIKPALAVIGIWTFIAAWNNFIGPLIYINSPEKMPISYATQLFSSSRGGDPTLLMAFATMSMLPVLLLFFFAQRYFIEGVTLSGLGGK